MVGRLREWTVISDHVSAEERLATYEMYESECTGHESTEIENASLIQMITNNAMSHKCVAQQVVAYESLRTKEKTSW